MSDRLFDPDTGVVLNQSESPQEPRPSRPPAPDQDHRDRIRLALNETLFVEAGAGSGKTSSLVGRIVELLRPPSGVPLRNIAAITFTEKAAAELRDRVRSELESRLAKDDLDEADRIAYAEAVDDLDGAAISTLHAFAQRVLSEHPVEAGLPPSIEVLDEISSQVAFDERWREFRDQLLDDPQFERSLLLAFSARVKIDHLRALAYAFNNNWDLLASRVPEVAAPGPVRVKEIIDRMRAVLGRRDECHAPDDTMLACLDALERFCERLERAPDDIDGVALLTQALNSTIIPKVGNKGRKDNWDDIVGLRADHKEMLELIAQVQGDAIDAVIKHLATAIRDFTLAATDLRRRTGRLEFHDLLVQSRDLLRSSNHGVQVSRALRQRYQRLLLDEFQDTDPIQIELAVLLATDPDGDSPRQPESAWNELSPDPGRLFFVGDPKQSIYRFRRADIALFLEARDRFGNPTVQLTANFRTTEPIIRWVNTTFADLIQFRTDSQPEYEPLTPTRDPAPVGPGMVLFGHKPHPPNIDAETLRDREAADVALSIRTALAERWQVSESEGTWRDARLGDFTILIPTRTSLPALERALESSNIPHRAETSSLVWSTREIRDLVITLRAVDDPTDELALAASLRSSVYGCGDDDLYTYRINHQGRWDHQAQLPESLPNGDPVGEAMTHLGDLHRRRMWMSPSELVETVIRDRKLMEQGIARGRPRDVWRRLRFVLDQARAYGDSEGGNLRQFLHWAELQSADGARVSETILPETDDDSVRIMTIHGSKGLEFPITIVSGLTTKPQRRAGTVEVAFPPGDEPAVIRLGKNLETTEYQQYVPLDEQMSHDERLRLLYVGCTRARDHLVVSTHRKEHRNDPTRDKMTSAELIAAAPEMADHRALEQPLNQGDLAPVIPAALIPAATLPPRDQWLAERDAALAVGSRQRSMSATTIAALASTQPTSPVSPDPDPVAVRPAIDPGLQKQERDLDLPPWMKGRYGTAVGRAVHAVLQTADLATGAGLAVAARAQAAAEGVIGAERTIEALAQSAIDSEVVAEAAASRYWRETYVAVPIGDATVEGYIDLLYEDPSTGDLVVVDHKTDAIDTDEALQHKLVRYRLQGATYALAVERATGRKVSRMVFLFLSPHGARAEEVLDLPAAMAEVEAIVRESSTPP
ncbi:MAG: UvrD-helicase domain-containing protein [Acidimicrobiales bacterium]